MAFQTRDSHGNRRRQMKALLSGVFALLILTLAPGQLFGDFWNFPPLPAPHEYGNILINRASEKHGVKPVFFSHWSHRLKYACRVCHLELDFAFSANTTEITEEENRNGLYCGACHNGIVAFGHTKENCNKCHSGTLSSGQERFEKITAQFPYAPFGNKLDWVAAVADGTIKPVYSLHGDQPESSIKFRERLELAAEWNYVPPAFFPHGPHIRLLDCANCHPDIFNIKKKTTKHFKMQYILEGRFCGVCHLRVAFPLNDCNRCHPGIESD